MIHSKCRLKASRMIAIEWVRSAASTRVSSRMLATTFDRSTLIRERYRDRGQKHGKRGKFRRQPTENVPYKAARVRRAGDGGPGGRIRRAGNYVSGRPDVRSASEHQGTESWEKPAVPSEGEHKARGKADRARAGARGGKGQERELKERPRPRPWPGTKLRKKNAEEA